MVAVPESGTGRAAHTSGVDDDLRTAIAIWTPDPEALTTVVLPLSTQDVTVQIRSARHG